MICTGMSQALQQISHTNHKLPAMALAMLRDFLLLVQVIELVHIAEYGGYDLVTLVVCSEMVGERIAITL